MGNDNREEHVLSILNNVDSINSDFIGVYNLINADKQLFPNFIIQIIITVVIIIVFLVIRGRASWVYYPNSLAVIKHPGYNYTGFFNWIYPVFQISDIELLAIIGLDSFMLLQVLKLLFRIFAFQVIFFCPVLFYLYSSKTDENHRSVSNDFYNQFYIKMSFIGSNHITRGITIVVFIYITTFLIFYLIFIYYKKYVTLRQVYLTNPASMTSIHMLKMISKSIPQDEDAFHYLSAMSYTVILDRLPSNISTNAEVLEYVKKLGIGEIEEAVLIRDTYMLQKHIEDRGNISISIEKEIDAAFSNFVKLFDVSESVEESFGQYYESEGLIQSAISYNKDKIYTLQEKVDLFNLFTQKGMKFFRRESENFTFLEIYLLQLKEYNQKISQEKAILLDEVKTDSTEEQTNPFQIENMSKDLYIHTNFSDDLSFLELDQIFETKYNEDIFSLNLPFKTNKAFVTFKKMKAAGIIKQSQIGTKVFGPKATQAPAPCDVLWKNITKCQPTKFFGSLASSFLFLSWNLVFYLFVAKIVDFLSSESITIKSLNWFIPDDQKETVINWYQNILAPMVYNTFILISSILIEFLVNFEGIDTYSKSQLRFMDFHFIFLFYNAFLAFFFSAPFVDFFHSIISNKKDVSLFLKPLGHQFIKTSVFFLNTTIQRTFTGCALILLKPVPFILNFIIFPLFKSTKREKLELKIGSTMDFGNAVPQLMLMFPIILSYSCIFPIFLPFGCLFYFFCYCIYKNDLFYCTINYYESGGIFWIKAVKLIIISLLGFQFFTFTVVFNNYGKYFLIFFFPIITADYYFATGIFSLFSSNCLNFPLNEPEETFLNEFSKKVIKRRRIFLSEWDEIDNERDENNYLPIHEIGIEKYKSADPKFTYYKNPSLGNNITNIILPEKFFLAIDFVHKCDKNNVFELN